MVLSETRGAGRARSPIWEKQVTKSRVAGPQEAPSSENEGCGAHLTYGAPPDRASRTTQRARAANRRAAQGDPADRRRAARRRREAEPRPAERSRDAGERDGGGARPQ